eukprot:scaffold4147_cov114-Skeletonema_dohrnii-CCMP3373.AAC.5
MHLHSAATSHTMVDTICPSRVPLRVSVLVEVKGELFGTCLQPGSCAQLLSNTSTAKLLGAVSCT